MNTFSISDSLKYGWETFKSNKGLWAASAVLVILSYLSGGKGRHHGEIDLIAILATIALLIAQVGFAKILLKIKDGETFDWPNTLENLFKTHKVFWKYIGASILSGIIMVIGFILLVVPGLVAISALAFATLIVVDTGMGPVAALKESREITRGNRLKILGFTIIFCFLNFVGAMLFGLGLFISLPVTMLAMVDVYRKLLAVKASPAPVVSPTQ